jgi:predicted MFS family arabinose efflux permease
MFVAIRSYARPDDRTRAVSLIRLAINLGFSLGPAIGGLIIATWGYSGLFWIDGLTCIMAMMLMWKGLPRRQGLKEGPAQQIATGRSPYRDGHYLFFLSILVVVGVPFLQYFSTVPLFYSEVHHLSEGTIGLLLGANGLFIFLVEVPLITYVEGRNFARFPILRASVVLFAASFAVMNLVPTIAFLWVGMAFMTVGEMLNFPFMNRFAYDRSDHGPPGAYMALFTIAWSVAHIVGHTLGLNLVAHFGYTTTWYLFTGVLLVAVGMLYWLERMIRIEQVTPEGR